MSFEFLAPDAASAFSGAAPAARSPIEWAQRDAGAQFTERAGWRVVADYGELAKEATACRETVGVADRSHLGKVELQGDPGVVAAAVSQLARGAALQLGTATLVDEVWWCPITAGRVLAITPPEATGQLRAELEAAVSEGPFASVVELTAALGSNAVVGPQARETFARVCALDMRPDRFLEGAFAPVSVARTPGMILRERGDQFLHLFGSGYAQYNWTVFVDAAESLGGRAVGDETLRAGKREAAARA
ncbi:MAG: hypothetical protein EXQ70_06420 [Solirubrobacterales bacterium]|nr:hypothetical protein [Solirubrobacterales bacterium]